MTTVYTNSGKYPAIFYSNLHGHFVQSRVSYIAVYIPIPPELKLFSGILKLDYLSFEGFISCKNLIVSFSSDWHIMGDEILIELDTIFTDSIAEMVNNNLDKIYTIQYKFHI